MATEALQILNLSPIPELSEMELSTVLEHLSGVSELNGEVTDRNVEDILREAEELIDMSSSFKADSVDSDKCGKNNNASDTCNNVDRDSKTDENKVDDSESFNEILNLSLSSEDSQKNLKSESNSSKNQVTSSEVDICSSSPRSTRNHIQSTLDTLRECSKKIENQAKNSSNIMKEAVDKVSCNKIDQLPSAEEKKSRNFKTVKKGSYFGEESERESVENPKTKNLEQPDRKVNLKLIERNKSFKKSVRGLSLDESIKTLDCFERLYRGRPVKDKIDHKRLKIQERTLNKRTGAGNAGKKSKSFKLETLNKDKKFRDGLSKSSACKISQQTCVHQCSDKDNTAKENLTDDEISFEKCLNLLQEESEYESNNVDVTSFNYLDFTEKVLKHCTESVSALQGEVEDLKCQLRKNETKDLNSNRDPNLVEKLWSQESLIQKLKEENLKLFKEVEEIKGQLKMAGASDVAGDSAKGDASTEKMEIVEKLREEVRNLRRSLITAYSENNGISRLEEQFSSLKAKYDGQIGKLERENKKLKEVLAGQSPRPVTEEEKKLEAGVRVGKLCVNVGSEEESVDPSPPIRSSSVENFRKTVRGPSPSQSWVDAATSPIRNGFFETNKELCSVSVQCRGESDLYDRVDSRGSSRSRDIFKGFDKLENKENVASNRRGCGKARPVLNRGNQFLNLLKHRKMSEHENQLMVTVRALRSEITVKDRDNKKMKNELEVLKSQIKRLGGDVVKHKSEVGKKFCHVGTQTIALILKTQEPYDPVMFQVSRELEEEKEKLKERVNELEEIVNQLKDKRINDLQILQKLHEEEIDKLASRLKSQTALTNHLHSLLTGR